MRIIESLDGITPSKEARHVTVPADTWPIHN